MTVLTLVIAIATVVVSFVVGITAWLIHRLTLRYQALVTIQMDYRSHQMGYAVYRLWRFYRVNCHCNETTLREVYSKTLNIEGENVNREETLDNQRRILFHFYTHLANLHANNILPPSYIFDNWPEETLRIIPLILIPMENKHVRIINAEFKEHADCKNKNLELKELPEDNILIRLYNDSLSYPNLLDKIYLLQVGWIGLIIAVIIELYFIFYVF